MRKTLIKPFLGFAALVLLTGCTPPETHLVHGTIVLTIDEGWTGTDTCTGVGPWSEHQEGRTLKMKEGSSSSAIPIDTARYSAGRITTYGCEFSFDFKIRPGFKQYTIWSCSADEPCQYIAYTYQELQADGFKLEWCMGCDGGELGGGSEVGGDQPVLTN